jgi:DNA repair photolyase
MPTIISASRRTDIPAFYIPWFMNRLRAGTVAYPNPYGGQIHTLSLRAEDVHSIVFWSKFYGPFLRHVDEIQSRGYVFYAHYTITGAPPHLEPNVPRWEQAVRVFRDLAARTSPRHVLWRFDPILLTDDLDAALYIDRFRHIAAALEGATTRCYFSFATFYAKATRRLEKAGIRYLDPSHEARQALVETLVAIAAKHGITLYACCQADLLNERVRQAHCVDADLLSELFPDRPLSGITHPTRAQCGCFASRDIGMYDSFPFGCLYCYANAGQTLTQADHDPHGLMLISR